MRIPFLILTPVCVFLGAATASAVAANIDYVDLALVLMAALLAHISVNTLNEYHDFRSGLDAKTSKTPFSGGSGALVDNPSAADAVFRVGVVTLIFTAFIGIYLVVGSATSLLPLGLIGILIVVTYTPWLNRFPLLCLVAPGIAFGPVMVIGAHVVLTGQHSLQALWASLVPFFLVSNLLLLNQFPDLEADKSIGRRHFSIVYGLKRSARLYGVFALAACGVIVAGVFAELLPALSMIALVPMLLTGTVFWGAQQHATSVQKLLPYMGANVAATVVTPLLLGFGIIYG